MTTINIVRVKYTELEVGDIVHFYGARFQITATKMIDHSDNRKDPALAALDDQVRVSVGKWLDGNVIDFYFGPKKDWTFQGNHYAIANIEERQI